MFLIRICIPYQTTTGKGANWPDILQQDRQQCDGADDGSVVLVGEGRVGPQYWSGVEGIHSLTI